MSKQDQGSHLGTPAMPDCNQASNTNHWLSKMQNVDVSIASPWLMPNNLVLLLQPSKSRDSLLRLNSASFRANNHIMVVIQLGQCCTASSSSVLPKRASSLILRSTMPFWWWAPMHSQWSSGCRLLLNHKIFCNFYRLARLLNDIFTRSVLSRVRSLISAT